MSSHFHVVSILAEDPVSGPLPQAVQWFVNFIRHTAFFAEEAREVTKRHLLRRVHNEIVATPEAFDPVLPLPLAHPLLHGILLPTVDSLGVAHQAVSLVVVVLAKIRVQRPADLTATHPATVRQ